MTLRATRKAVRRDSAKVVGTMNAAKTMNVHRLDRKALSRIMSR